MNLLKRITGKTKRHSRARDVFALLVVFMTYFIVAKSVQAETHLASFATLAHMHMANGSDAISATGAGSFEASKIKINLATEPGSDHQDPDDDGTCDTLVDLDIDHFLLTPFTFDFGTVSATRHPHIDLSLTLPSMGFGLEYPPELA